MKKVNIIIGAMVAAVAAANGAPLYLTFRTVDGAERSFSAESIEMTVNNGKLLVSNSESQANFELTSLASMRFTDNKVEEDESALSEISVIDRVTVYSLKGEEMGVYTSVADAESKLPAGTYIFKTVSQTVKKTIR